MLKSKTLSFEVPAEVKELLSECPDLIVAESIAELVELSTRDADEFGWHEVAYDVPESGQVVEARVCRTRNGVAANYTDPYMRRRDPDCMVIGDGRPTNKKRFSDRFGKEFDDLRQETFEWLKNQELALFPFFAGDPEGGMPALVIAPQNAGFFALGLAL